METPDAVLLRSVGLFSPSMNKQLRKGGCLDRSSMFLQDSRTCARAFAPLRGDFGQGLGYPGGCFQVTPVQLFAHFYSLLTEIRGRGGTQALSVVGYRSVGVETARVETQVNPLIREISQLHP